MPLRSCTFKCCLRTRLKLLWAMSLWFLIRALRQACTTASSPSTATGMAAQLGVDKDRQWHSGILISAVLVRTISRTRAHNTYTKHKPQSTKHKAHEAHKAQSTHKAHAKHTQSTRKAHAKHTHSTHKAHRTHIRNKFSQFIKSSYAIANSPV
jgi:hypothetical protein